MAKEIIKKTESFILVQIDEEGVERAIYQDSYRGGFNSTEEMMMAQRYNDGEKAKKVADALNMLYQLTGKNFTAKAAKETIDREFLDGYVNEVNSFEEDTEAVS